MPSFFITGTDTGVGKTTFTCRLLQGWLDLGYNAAALKPISTGDRNDAIEIKGVPGSLLDLDEINPVHFQKPVAPLLAARAENRSIDFTTLNSEIQTRAANFSHLAVEGVGGWRVPLAPHYEVREWARDLGFPVVVLARGTLGTLNHTLLTVDSIRDAGLACAGIVVNSMPEEYDLPHLNLTRLENVALLRELLGVPVFEFDRRTQASGSVPVWLGGKKI
jgi:dethiobiotin synthetase